MTTPKRMYEQGLEGLTTSQCLKDAGFHFSQATQWWLSAILKRVPILSPTQTIFNLILLILFPNIFLHCWRIHSYCSYVISCCPEISVPKLLVRVSLEYHHCTFPRIPHKTRHTHFRRDTHQDVYIIWHHISFYDFCFFPFTQSSDTFPDIFSSLILDYFSPIFRRKYYVVLPCPFRMC